MAVTALYPIMAGIEVMDKSASTFNIDRGTIVDEPIMAYLLQTDQGWVLIDTGFDTEVLRNADLAARYLGAYPPKVEPHHELIPQMERIGVRPVDIGTVVITHLHLDHGGGLRSFTHARVLLQREEFEAATSGGAQRILGYSPQIHWELLDGDVDLLPGLRLLSTPGHTPGHMSVLVDLPHSGPILLGIDVADLIENFEHDIPPGGHVDLEAALASLKRCKSIALRAGGRLFPGHDLAFWQRMRTLPSYYA